MKHLSLTSLLALLVAVLLALHLLHEVDASETEINLIFKDMIPPAGSSSCGSCSCPGDEMVGTPTQAIVALPEDYASLDCEEKLDSLTEALKNFEENALQVINDALALAHQQYIAAAKDAGVDPQELLPSPDMLFDEGVGNNPKLGSCEDLVQESLARLHAREKHADELDQMRIRYNMLTAELVNATRGMTRKEWVDEWYQRRSLSRRVDQERCGETQDSGFDYLVVKVKTYRRDNCDGSKDIWGGASAFSIGMLDFNCHIPSSGSASGCSAGSGKGVHVGLAKAYIYFGVNMDNRGRAIGFYIRPEACYWWVYAVQYCHNGTEKTSSPSSLWSLLKLTVVFLCM